MERVQQTTIIYIHREKWASDGIAPGKVLVLFLDEKVMSLLVAETNRYADQKLLQHANTEHARIKRWKPTTSEEIKTFIGLMIWMGLAQIPFIRLVNGPYLQFSVST